MLKIIYLEQGIQVALVDILKFNIKKGERNKRRKKNIYNNTYMILCFFRGHFGQEPYMKRPRGNLEGILHVEVEERTGMGRKTRLVRVQQIKECWADHDLRHHIHCRNSPHSWQLDFLSLIKSLLS